MRSSVTATVCTRGGRARSRPSLRDASATVACDGAGCPQAAAAPAATRCRPPAPRRRPASRRRPGRRRRATTAAARPGRSAPSPKLACRSAPESKPSRESLACTRSIRPVTALTSVDRRRPARCRRRSAWQVSRQKPDSTARPDERVPEPAIASSRRAIALSPPAVFSMSTGSGGSSRSKALRQLSKPAPGRRPCRRGRRAPSAPRRRSRRPRRRLLEQLAAGDAESNSDFLVRYEPFPRFNKQY